jgi:hypothetical protein
LVGGYDGLRGLAASDVERFLQGAKIVRVREIGEGVTKPLRATLEDGPLRHDAAIQSVDASRDSMPPGQLLPIPVCDSYKYNLAAYEIGKLLGLSSIPPCVAREYRGRKAAFTWWIDEAMTLTKMREKHLRPPDMASWNTQQFTIGIFDELIFNIDRNQGNLLVDPAWRVWMIDHTRAFRTGLALRNPVLLSRMKLDSALREHLQGLTGADLERCCREYLEPEERGALLARRDTILARLR